VLRDGIPVAGDNGGGLMLLAEVRSTRQLGHALRRLRLSPVIDTFDKVLAGYRKHLGRFVPDGPAPLRYP
jgi:hypothetical protein